jgi:hypothetical protein
MDPPRRTPTRAFFGPLRRCILIMGIVAFGGDACTTDEGVDSGDWVTTDTEGFSLSLPGSFTVFTDQQRLLDELNRLGHEQQANIIASFDGNPYSFVLFGTEPQYQAGWATTVLAFRAPTLGLSLKEFTQTFAEGIEQGPKNIVQQTRRTVGVGNFPAMQLDIEVEMPGAGVSLGRYFVLRNKSDTWIVTYDFPASEATRMERAWRRSIASLALA